MKQLDEILEPKRVNRKEALDELESHWEKIHHHVDALHQLTGVSGNLHKSVVKSKGKTDYLQKLHDHVLELLDKADEAHHSSTHHLKDRKPGAPRKQREPTPQKPKTEFQQKLHDTMQGKKHKEPEKKVSPFSSFLKKSFDKQKSKIVKKFKS